MASAATGRRRRAACLALLVAIPMSLLAACTEGFDAGATPQEQLCRALAGLGEDRSARVRPLLDELASTGEVPIELAAIDLVVGLHADDFDRLGEYEPFIDFAKAVGEFHDRDLPASNGADLEREPPLQPDRP